MYVTLNFKKCTIKSIWVISQIREFYRSLIQLPVVVLLLSLEKVAQLIGLNFPDLHWFQGRLKR